MKKMYVVLLSVVICLSCICFVGCGDKDEIPSFEEVQPGYFLTVYPDYEFDYVVSDDCTVHIKEIKIELTQKRLIEPNSTLTSPYEPYVFHISAKGFTDEKFANKKIYLRLINEQTYKTFYYYDAIIQPDGSIYWDYDQGGWYSLENVYFGYVSFDA